MSIATTAAIQPQQKQVHSKRYDKRLFQTLWELYKPYRTTVLLISMIGLLGRLVLLFNANLLGWWVDSISNQVSHPVPKILAGFSTPDYLLLIAVSVFLGFGMTLAFRIILSRTSARAVSQLYDQVTERASRFPISFYDTTPVGKVVTRFSSDYGNVFRMFGGPLSDIVSITFELISIAILMTVAHPAYLLIFISTATVQYLFYRSQVTKIREERRKYSIVREPSISHFSETVQGSSAIRVFQKENSFFSRFLRLDNEYLGQKRNLFQFLQNFTFKINSLTAVLFLCSGLFATYLYRYEIVSIGSVGVLLGFVVLAGNSLQTLFEWITQLEEALTGVERLDEYLHKEIEPHSTPAAAPTVVPKEKVKRVRKQISASLEIKNLSLRYSDTLPWVLSDVSFKIDPGEHVGIVGRTGSGKSSLISAIYGLYPFQGSIKIENQSISDLGLKAFRDQISFIAQEPMVFRGNLRENLCLGRIYSENQIQEVLTQVGLDGWDLDRFVEERGKNLSLGERQLLCMARCLLQDRPLVIMDEATSSIDPQTEERLIKTTSELLKPKSQIIIAHRLSTLQDCDRVVCIQKGRVAAEGTPAQILERFGSLEAELH